MNFYIDKSHPICPQIYEQICLGVASKKFTVNEKIFSVRELALKLGVNPNTVQKSYEMLERKGVIYSIRGSGWYVSENLSVANEVLLELVKKKTDVYFMEMELLGYNKAAIFKYINERIGENNE